MARIIDEFPTMRQVEDAASHEIVAWHFYLRPTMRNEELDIVKAIAQRYDAMPASVREALLVQVRRAHE